MGGRITGIGTNRLEIEGQKALKGADYTIGPDYIEVGSLITLAAVTGGALRIQDARPEEHRATQLAFGKLGLHFEPDSETGRDIIVPGDQSLQVQPDLGGAIPKIEDAPWPGFPADLTSIAVVAATQTEGTTLIFEKMFESRLFFVDRLASMGARLILCDRSFIVNVSSETRVLVVDDEPVLRKLFERILETTGIQVQTASSGQEALELLEQQTFDAILLDMKMPGISGVEAVTVIRRNQPDLPIVAMSGYVDDTDRETLKNCGVHTVLTKPVQKNVLLEELNMALAPSV